MIALGRRSRMHLTFKERGSAINTFPKASLKLVMGAWLEGLHQVLLKEDKISLILLDRAINK